MTPFPRTDYRTLSRYAPGRSPAELDLSDNTNLWGGHPAAIQVMRRASGNQIARYPDLYADHLKAAVARRFGLPEATVCTGCGSDDLLDSAFRAAEEGRGIVAYPGPTFSMIDPFSRMNGRTPREVPWSAALNDPTTLLREDPVLVYVCRPNNPTGAMAPREWLDALVGVAARRSGGGPLIVVDEAYADFARESVVSDAAETWKRVLVVRTLSKAFGLAGLRVGFGIGSPQVVDEVEKSRGPYKVGRLTEAAAVAALDDPDGWVARTVERALESRQKLESGLRERHLRPLPSRANFVLVPVAEGTAVEKADALRKHGVGVRPFPDCADVGDALRITVGPPEMMDDFFRALDAARREDPAAWGGEDPPDPGTDADPEGGGGDDGGGDGGGGGDDRGGGADERAADDAIRSLFR